MSIHIILATEDSLSEAVAKKILSQSDKNYEINCIGGKGFGYLKNKILDLNKTAKSIPVFVLIDQDSGCPLEKIKTWLDNKANPKLIFRIAVMEIESWVMADRKAISKFLSIPITEFPNETDKIQDPKQFLLNIVKKKCRSKTLIDDIVPKQGSSAKVGPNYNPCLTGFIKENWNVREAIKCSESLQRAFHRIMNFCG